MNSIEKKTDSLVARRILIGSHPDNDVVMDAPGVSRYHAALTIPAEPGEPFLLEDTGAREKMILSPGKEPQFPGSTNGTFVNGLQVRHKTVTLQDQVRLAAMRLDLAAVVNRVMVSPKTVVAKTDPNDFVEEFLVLRQLYESFKTARFSLQRKAELANATKIIPGVGFGLYALASLALKTNEKLFMLNEEFRKQYVCPKCKIPLGDLPWESLANQKTCIRCKAIWSR